MKKTTAELARDALQSGLAYVENNANQWTTKAYREAIAAIEADIAQAAEPVAWRDVVGFEGLYEVCSNGKIRSTKTDTVLSGSLMGAGYVKADLWKNGERKQTSAHRVVAEAFFGPGEEREVNHKNGVKTDNRAENLEWVSKSENNYHRLYKLGNGVKPVTSTNVKTGEVMHYDSIADADRDGLSSWQICNCLKGRIALYKECTWQYAAPQEPAAPVNAELLEALKSASDYIDVLGGVSKGYRIIAGGAA